MAKPKIKVTSDNTKNFMNVIRTLKDQEVLVGIPEDDTTRNDAEEAGTVTNAFLLYINENGSPANNIPERPAMKIGLSIAADDIAEQFYLGAKNALDGGQDAIDKYYNRAGFIASSAIKKVINDQTGLKEPAESTIASRKSRGFKGTKALIVTGQMRNAITHVVRDKSWLK